MQEKAETIKLDPYIKLIFKHRWLIIIPFCLAMTTGICLAFMLPKIYEASNLIIVEPQRVPKNYVRAIVSTDIAHRISTIEQQILSRTNLEKVVEEFNIYSDLGNKNMFMEDKVSLIRTRIAVKVSKTRRGLNTFSISFQDEDPETAMKVANNLATHFIDENLKIREAQATGTSDFIKDELQTMRNQLEEVEVELREYRARYRGEMPEQLHSNLKILENLQLQLSEREERLSDEKDRLVMIENEITTRTESIAADGFVQSESGQKGTLLQLKEQLAGLQSRYTDRHPDIIRLKTRIDDLEAESRSGKQDSMEGATANSFRTQDQILSSDILSDQLKQKLEIEAGIKDIKDDILKLKNQIRTYQQRIEQTPKREEALLALNRDYNNIKASYSSLLNRKLEADIAVNMEKKQKGEQFRVIDPAILPRKSVSPDVIMLYMISVLSGLGVGVGLIFLIDFFDLSIKNLEKFESDFGINMLATIPKVYHKKDLRLRRLNNVMTVFSLLVAACLFAGFAVLFFKGIEPTIEIVRPYIAFFEL